MHTLSDAQFEFMTLHIWQYDCKGNYNSSDKGTLIRNTFFGGLKLAATHVSEAYRKC